MNAGRGIRLKSVAVVSFIVGLLASLSLAATGHGWEDHYSAAWPSDTGYKLGNLNFPLNTSSAKSSIHYGDNPWNATSSWHDFSYQGTDGTVVWTGSNCTTGYGNRLWIVTASVSGLGVTGICWSSGTITHSTMRLDHTESTWYTGSSSTVPAGKYDLRSTTVHEFGHAGGFVGHWGSNEVDCTGSNRHTMCAILYSATSYQRSLETHDKHIYDDRY